MSGPAPRRRRAALAAGAAALSLCLSLGGAGCAREPERLDQAATERTVGEVVADRVDLGVDRVRCPGDIPREQGATVVCTVRFDDVDRPLNVTVRQADGSGRLSVTFRQAVVDRADVADDLRRTLVERFERTFLVDCGEAGPLVVDPGRHLSCKARDRGGPRAVDVTVVDTAGTLRYRIG